MRVSPVGPKKRLFLHPSLVCVSVELWLCHQDSEVSSVQGSRALSSVMHGAGAVVSGGCATLLHPLSSNPTRPCRVGVAGPIWR